MFIKTPATVGKSLKLNYNYETNNKKYSLVRITWDKHYFNENLTFQSWKVSILCPSAFISDN